MEGAVKGLSYYRDIYSSRNFDDVEEAAFLSHVLETEHKLIFDPYSVEEEVNSALDVYGLRVNGVSYGIHPILNILFTFTPEAVVN